MTAVDARLSHEPSYWAATAKIPEAGPPLAGDLDCDVAVIGAGYTGLSTAWHLQRRYGIGSAVLEANRVGWGCSGRNGGFAMIGVGKDTYSGWLKRLGEQGAREVFELGREAVRTVRAVLAENRIDAASPHEGFLYLAHRPSRMRELRSTQQILREKFCFATELLSADEMRREHLNGTDVHGALLHPEHFPLHPMRYVQGLACAVRMQGVAIHERSPVIGWERAGRRHVLRTPQGSVRAARVIIATNAYTPETLHPSLGGRLLNVLSNILVTAPLTDEQLAACNWRTHRMLVDTRMLRFYFRLLEDRRLMWGARGGVEATATCDTTMRRWLMRELVRQFPGLTGIREEYFWRGWVAITRDMSPHLCAVDDATVFFACGYAGTGVALSTHSGKLLAEALATGRPLERLPMVGAPLPRFEMPALRKWYQRAAYVYYYFRDKYS